MMGSHENRSVSNTSLVVDSEQLESAMTHESKILIDSHCHFGMDPYMTSTKIFLKFYISCSQISCIS